MSLVLKIALGIVVGVILLLVGCTAIFAVAGSVDTESETGIVRVIAPGDKCWAGAIGDSSKQGCGIKSFTIEGESVIVANAQKETPGRWSLELILEIDEVEVDRAETMAEFGFVTVEEG